MNFYVILGKLVQAIILDRSLHNYIAYLGAAIIMEWQTVALRSYNDNVERERRTLLMYYRLSRDCAEYTG